jgi:D-alanyl-lipoteichoic acid acyltransferase DltB (MBOAT superfamily)
LAGKLIGDSKHVKYRKLILTLSLCVNFGILFVFKYFNFLIHAIEDVSSQLHNPVHFDVINVLLPVGISFYTFHSISYVIDVYRKKIPVEKNVFRFLLFVSFFPQLVAGPIARSESLLPQLQEFENYKYDNFRKGFVLIFWGFFKKMVIADRLAIAVNHVYNNVDHASSLSLIIATIFFTYQIYCDFSGYSDIALGVSKLFGVDLMVNFRNPYFSKTVTEFWRRWHISLSTWFRDYLYIPLGGNKSSQGKWIFNTLLVFMISGLWHGANYTFLIWGTIHGLILVLEKFVYGKKIRDITSGITPINIIRWAFTYCIVIIAWVFFRANNLRDAALVFKKILSFDNLSHNMRTLFAHDGAMNMLGINIYDFVLSIVFIIVLVLINFFLRKKGIVEFILNQSLIKRWVFYILITFVILWFGEFGINEFIYFQF